MPTNTVGRRTEEKPEIRAFEHVEMEAVFSQGKAGRCVCTWIGDKFMSSTLFAFNIFAQ